MYFKTDISGITTEQLAVISAVETLFQEQSMTCTVTSLDPISFELKPQLSELMRKRLIVDRVGVAAPNYTALVRGNELVIQKIAGVDAPKRTRKRADKGDTDLRESA